MTATTKVNYFRIRAFAADLQAAIHAGKLDDVYDYYLKSTLAPAGKQGIANHRLRAASMPVTTFLAMQFNQTMDSDGIYLSAGAELRRWFYCPEYRLQERFEEIVWQSFSRTLLKRLKDVGAIGNGTS